MTLTYEINMKFLYSYLLFNSGSNALGKQITLKCLVQGHPRSNVKMDLNSPCLVSARVGE